MSRRARYSRGNDRLDEHTSKQIGSSLFGGFNQEKRDDKGILTNYDELVKDSRDLMKFHIIQGKNHAQAIIYYSSMRDLYRSPSALKMVNILMATSISVNGVGREQGTVILKGQLPDEIETLVSDL